MEINKRKECVIMLNKLHVFVYNTDNTVARKILMLNAILIAEMMYGLETLVMNTRDFNKLPRHVPAQMSPQHIERANYFHRQIILKCTNQIQYEPNIATGQT